MTNTPPDDRQPGRLRRNLFRLRIFRNAPRSWWATVGMVAGTLIGDAPTWGVALASTALILTAVVRDRANVDGLQTARLMRAVRRTTATEMRTGDATASGPGAFANTGVIRTAERRDDVLDGGPLDWPGWQSLRRCICHPDAINHLPQCPERR